MKNRFFILSFLLFVFVSNGQKMDQNRLNDLSVKYANSSFPLLKELLSIPNDAFYPEDIEKNVKWCEKAFAARNFAISRITTAKAPLLLAERKSEKAQKTVLI